MDYKFYVNDFDRVKDHRLVYPAVSKIFEQPVSFWFGERNGRGTCNLDKRLKRFFKRTDPYNPIMVIYNIPDRDMGHHSKGGAKYTEDYLNFCEDVSKQIGDREVILIYEPDALPHSTLMDDDAMAWRHGLMKQALKIITKNCSAKVYIDIGHSNWLSPEQAGKMLNAVTVDGVRGFAVNVSNFRATPECIKWGKRVSEYADIKHFVIDTSRNGNGPYGNEWCNPPGRALGHNPTTDTGEPLCDAFLWIKIPGESDGKANGGPRAGKFWPEYANELVKNTYG